MPLPVLLQIVSTCSIVIGSACAILAYLRGARTHRETLNAQIFLNLTQRHAGLIELRRLEADLRLGEGWDGDLATAAAVREYFDLLAHEHALVGLGILDQRVWALWQGDIARLVRTRLISEVWRKRTRQLHRASPEFVEYIDAVIGERGELAASARAAGPVAGESSRLVSAGA